MYLNLQLIHHSVLILGCRGQDAEELERLGLVSPDMTAVEQARMRMEAIAREGLSEARFDENDLAEFRRCGETLFDEVMPFTLREWLSKAKPQSEELVIQTCAALFDLPFELMHTGSDFLAATLPIRRVRPEFVGRSSERESALRARSTRRESAAQTRYVLIGDPAGDLAAAREETAKIYEQFRCKGRRIELRNAEVYADEVAGALERCEHAHIAGHFDEGRLRCADDEHFEGWGTLRSRPHSLTLNGCSSLIHDGALTPTVTQALRAGVRNMIGTALPIPDAFASHFALQLHLEGQHLAHPDHRSLFQTRRALTKVYGEEALIWGAYTYIGEPSSPEPATDVLQQEWGRDHAVDRPEDPLVAADERPAQSCPEGVGSSLARGRTSAFGDGEAIEKRLNALEKVTLTLALITAILLFVTLSP